MQSIIEEPEVIRAREMFQDAIFSIEAEGRSVQSFATAALMAASEVYGEVWGGDELRRAFVKIAQAEEIANGGAGRA